MHRVISLLGIIAGALSVVMLIKQGVEFGMAAPLELMFNWYDAFIGYIASFFEPPLRLAFSWLNERLPVQLHLTSHWKHLMVLLITLFAALVRDASERGGERGARRLLMSGVVLSAGVFFADSSFPLPPNQSPLPLSEALRVSVPILLLAGACVVISAWFYRWRERWIGGNVKTTMLYCIALGILVAVIPVRIVTASILPSPAVVFLGAYIIGFGIFLVVEGAFLAFDPGRLDQSRRIPFRIRWWLTTSYVAQMGFVILTPFIAAFVFIALNAGLQLAGLVVGSPNKHAQRGHCASVKSWSPRGVKWVSLSDFRQASSGGSLQQNRRVDREHLRDPLHHVEACAVGLSLQIAHVTPADVGAKRQLLLGQASLGSPVAR